MQKYLIAVLIGLFTQHKPDWSEMDVIILINEFFHIQIYITFEYFRPPLLKLTYKNKASKTIRAVPQRQTVMPKKFMK